VNSFTISFPLGAVSTAVIGAVVLCGSRFKLPAPVAGHHLGPLGQADNVVAIGLWDRLPMPGRMSPAESFLVFFELADLPIVQIAEASCLAG